MSHHTTPSKLGTRLPWIIAAVAVAALAVTLFMGRDTGTGTAGEVTLAELSERLEALETGRPGVGIRGAGLSPGAHLGTGQGGEGISGLGGRLEQRTPEQNEAERAQQLRELESQFARDAADPVGGPRTENTLVKTISSETMAVTGLKPNDVDIACKKNSCRIVGTFDRSGDAQDWSLFYITAAGGNVLSNTSMVFVPKPDGRTEVRIYSARAR